MLVYRICKKEEVEKLRNTRDFSLLGTYNEKNNKNNHEYLTSIKYLHFFKAKDSILYLSKKNQYLCTYEIPESILKRYQGIGFYLDYIFFRNLNKVVEYAIPIHYLDWKFLIRIDELKDMLKIEDFLEDNILTNTIYEKETNTLKRIKKNL